MSRSLRCTLRTSTKPKPVSTVDHAQAASWYLPVPSQSSHTVVDSAWRRSGRMLLLRTGRPSAGLHRTLALNIVAVVDGVVQVLKDSGSPSSLSCQVYGIPALAGAMQNAVGSSLHPSAHCSPFDVTVADSKAQLDIHFLMTLAAFAPAALVC